MRTWHFICGVIFAFILALDIQHKSIGWVVFDLFMLLWAAVGVASSD